MTEVKCEKCGRPKLLISYLGEDKTQYIVECPVDGLREVIKEGE